MPRPGCAGCSTTSRHFDSARAHKELASYRRSGPGKTTGLLLMGLADVGAEGTLLDVGSGIGVLTLEFLKAKGEQAVCVDLSGDSLRLGQQVAELAGIADRIQWREGDFVDLAPGLPSAEVVALDRVVCCYPAYGPLLEHAAEHCRRFLAMSFPRDRWHVRMALWFENSWRRIRGNSFRAFVHRPQALEDVVGRAGFVPVYRASTLTWITAVYRRSTGKLDGDAEPSLLVDREDRGWT